MTSFGPRCQRSDERGPKEGYPEYPSSTHIAANDAFADYTLQEYLDRNQAILSPNPHAVVARRCLAFLSFDDFSKKPPEHWRWQPYPRHIVSPFTGAVSYPYQFTRYATFSWGDHVRRAGEAKVLDAILDFLSRPANVAWLVTMVADRWPVPSERQFHEELSLRDPDFLKMLLAVKFNLKFVLVELLKTRTRPAETALDPVISRLACNATNCGNKDIVRLLLTQKDVDWNVCSADGEYLLMLLVRCDDEDNLRTLLQKKSCSVNTITDQGNALLWAVGFRYTSITRTLLEAGADVDARGNYGQCVIIQAMNAMASGELWGKMMDLLLEYKADINALSWSGNTPLHYAAQAPILETYAVEHLVSKGANLNLPNQLRKTPLDMAKDAVFQAGAVYSKGKRRYSKDEVESATRSYPSSRKQVEKPLKRCVNPPSARRVHAFPPNGWTDWKK